MSTPSTPATGVGLQLGSVASVQFGAAVAAQLFSRVGPLGTVSLRLVFAAAVLTLVTRPWRRSWSGADLGAALLFGAVLTGMNSALYLSLDRLPLATVITLEFLGPLLLAIATATTWATRGWAVPAAAGVLLLGGGLRAGDLLGIVFALLAACCWAAYIVLNGRLGRAGSGLSGLALATCAGAVIMLPVGAATGGADLLRPEVLAVGAAVGVLSSAIPYSLDLLALRRLPTAVFGVITSLNPGVAAVAGFAVLGQALSGRQLTGIALVTLASVGVTLSSAMLARTSRRRARIVGAAAVVAPSGRI